jgi:ERCC4-type nuclease
VPLPVIAHAPDTNAPDLTLPGLRGLSGLADCKPVIVIDSREQAPLQFERLQAVSGSLYSGDYSAAGLEDSFAIERKSIDDLVNCCLAGQRERFEHELHRLRRYRFKRLLIVGSREDIAAGRYRSRISPKSVLATLGAFEWAPTACCADAPNRAPGEPARRRADTAPKSSILCQVLIAVF